MASTLARTEATLLTSFTSPYSNTTLPCTATSIAVVLWVLSQVRSSSSRALEYPSDSGLILSQSTPGKAAVEDCALPAAEANPQKNKTTSARHRDPCRTPLRPQYVALNPR